MLLLSLAPACLGARAIGVPAQAKIRWSNIIHHDQNRVSQLAEQADSGQSFMRDERQPHFFNEAERVKNQKTAGFILRGTNLSSQMFLLCRPRVNLRPISCE